jgi:hypothetical protein
MCVSISGLKGESSPIINWREWLDFPEMMFLIFWKNDGSLVKKWSMLREDLKYQGLERVKGFGIPEHRLFDGKNRRFRTSKTD